MYVNSAKLNLRKKIAEKFECEENGEKKLCWLASEIIFREPIIKEIFVC